MEVSLKNGDPQNGWFQNGKSDEKNDYTYNDIVGFILLWI